jgi:YesN/AraC family two-component response regulator
MIRVIIVDDHPVVRRGLKQIIAAEQEMQIVGEAENAWDAIRERAEVVIFVPLIQARANVFP